jgi:hypothetical protein
MRKWHLKSCLVVPVILLVAIMAASAQRKLNFRSVEMGLGPAMVSIHDNDPLTDRMPKPSFAASAGLVYSLKRNLFITNHVMYELKGGEVMKYFRDGEIPPAYYNYSLSYLSVAPGVRRYIRTKSSVFIEGGPFIAFLMGSNGQKRFSVNPFSTFDGGVSLSVGYTPNRPQYRGLNLRLVNNTGLRDIGLDTGTKEWTNSLSLIIGMRVRMK